MKSRLTITLSQSTLNRIDKLINNTSVRNRSHAIESILEQSLKPDVDTALILAGGNGKKKSELPESLTLIQGKPLILHQIEHLKQYGVTHLVIATSKESTAIEKLLGTGKNHGIEITYLYEKEPLGTAGALLAAKKFLDRDLFFVLSGDVLTSINLDDMVAFHQSKQAIVTMAVKPRLPKSSYDTVYMQGDRIVDFQKNQPDQQVTIVNTGVYIMDAKIFSSIPHQKKAMLEQDVFPRLVEQQAMVAFTFQGIWFDITADSNYKNTKLKNS